MDPERCSNCPEPAQPRLAIVGTGRLGSAFARALDMMGSIEPDATSSIQPVGPLGRGADGAGCDAVLLCVPDAEIALAAAAIAPGPLVGHCSGATGLEPLAPHEAFSLHPLMTVTAAGADFTGATAAIDGATDAALAFATRLAGALRMEALRVSPEDRPAYHAAASIASNFLVTLEAAAERARGDRGDPATDAGAARARDRRELGRNGRRARSHRSGRPR